MMMLPALLVGLGAGYSGARVFASTQQPSIDITRQGGYEFINPLLSCDFSEDIQYSGYSELQQKLQQAVNGFIANGDATRISVYFRDMDDGNWIGINPTDRFAPASLMKVPILIAYEYQARTNASILDTVYPLKVNGDQNVNETFKPSQPLTIGQNYTVQELLDAMTKQSDNNAMTVLADHIATSSLDDVYSNFDVPPTTDENADSLSPDDYMRFFRILYNGTYLGRTRSADTLEMLAETDFDQGLVAGVPAGVTVSHKFGERSVEDVDPTTGQTTLEKSELHDCGIVYYSGSPYGICIMTEGTNFTQLSNVIAQLSQIAYQEVDGGLLGR